MPLVHLYTTPPSRGLPSNSPACAKLETWMRMAGVEYDKPPLDFARAPKGKIPFIGIGDGDDEQLMGDSTLIIEHLKTTHGVDLDASLSPVQRATSLAFRRMLKENDYWAAVLINYAIPENWSIYSEILGSVLAPDQPPEVRQQVAEDYKVAMMETTKGHGMGRHSIDEVGTIFAQDLDALATFLGDNTWMMGGEEPTTLDATVFGYFANVAYSPYEDALSQNARKHENLLALSERIQARYFPELIEPASSS